MFSSSHTLIVRFFLYFSFVSCPNCMIFIGSLRPHIDGLAFHFLVSQSLALTIQLFLYVFLQAYPDCFIFFFLIFLAHSLPLFFIAWSLAFHVDIVNVLFNRTLLEIHVDVACFPTGRSMSIFHDLIEPASCWDKFGGLSYSSTKPTSFCLCIHLLYLWTLPKRGIFVDPKICSKFIFTLVESNFFSKISNSITFEFFGPLTPFNSQFLLFCILFYFSFFHFISFLLFPLFSLFPLTPPTHTFLSQLEKSLILSLIYSFLFPFSLPFFS